MKPTFAQDPSFRGIVPPLTEQQLLPLDPRCERIQIYEPLSEQEHSRIARFLRDYPKIRLRLVGSLGRAFDDLRFLRKYAGLQSLAVDINGLHSTEGLEVLAPSLTTLIIESGGARPLPEGLLTRFQSLRALCLPNSRSMLDEAIVLPELSVLSLNAIRNLNVNKLVEARKLRGLAIGLGSIANASELAKLIKLRRLDLWRVRGIENADFLADMVSLCQVDLQDLPQIERFPSLKRLDQLHRFLIQGMKSLVDISGAADSPGLKELLVFASPKLTPESFKPFVGHPSLTHASVALGSVKKNTAIKELLLLPDPDRFGKGIFGDEALLRE